MTSTSEFGGTLLRFFCCQVKRNVRELENEQRERKSEIHIRRYKQTYTQTEERGSERETEKWRRGE